MTMTAQDDICDVRIDCDGWDEIEPAALAEMCIRAVAAVHPKADGPVSVLFTDDEAMKALNAAYRGKDRATNVLSFPAGDDLPPGEAYLGDIALGIETCRAEAAARDVSLRAHAAHLIIHGVLHLIGYDHDDDADAAVMEAQESIILARLGVPDPYAGPDGQSCGDE